MYQRRGAYYYVRSGVWTPLGRDYRAALAQYKRIHRPANPKRDFKTSTHLYIIGPACGNKPIKIGIAGNVRARLAGIQPSSFVDLEVKHSTAFRGRAEARRVEQVLHEHFAERRMRGEWFNVDHEEAASTLFLARKPSNKSSNNGGNM